MQELYIDVVKVYQDVAHVGMAIHVYFKYMFQMFHHMLQVFYLNVAKVDLEVAYTCMLQEYEYFQVFHTYVCKYLILMLRMFAMVFKCF
jgi:hypothetical protein